MKHVVHMEQVYHLWANQSQDSARNPGGNAYFDGPRCFSYGYRFEIARHYANQKGEACVLFTRRTYSTTTAKHLWEARGAVRHKKVFLVANPAEYHTYSLQNDKNHSQGREWDKAQLEKDCALYIEDAIEAIVKAKRARSNGPSLLSTAQRNLEQAAEMKAFFKLRINVPEYTALVSSDIVAQVKARQDKEAKQRAAQRKKEEEARAVREAEQRIKGEAIFALWRVGVASIRCPYSYRNDEQGSAYLRLVRKVVQVVASPEWILANPDKIDQAGKIMDDKDTVQTSQGAEVPFAAAVRAYQLVKYCKENGRAFVRNGQTARVGAFTIDRISEEGNANIGCHFFTWERIAEFAELAGITDTGSSNELLTKTVGENEHA